MEEEVEPTADIQMKAPDSTDKAPRIYFNSVTGEIMKDGVDERDMYEVDDDDQREQEENQIDQYTDVSPQDKKFFKLWNRFINPKEKNRMNMDKYLTEFIEQNLPEINANGLRESLLLHMICLYDYEQIDKGTFLTVVNLLESNRVRNGGDKDRA